MTPASLFSRVRATGRLWNSLLVVLDVVVVFLSTVLAYYARFEGAVPEVFARLMLPLAAVSSVVFCALFAAFGLYRLVLRYVSVDTLLRLAAAVVIGSTLVLGIDLLLPLEQSMRPVPVGVLFIQGVLVFLGASAARFTARVFLHLRSARPGDRRRVLIIGAGSAGSLVLREIQSRPDLELSVVGFLDDQRALRGRTINGVPVLGATDDLESVVDERGVQEVIVAMPSADRETVRGILNAAADADVQTRVVPALVIAKGSVSLRDLRPVDVEDLLGREPTPIDVAQVAETIAGKVVAVTGAAGSIGSELCRQIMTLGPRRLLLVEIDETRLYELWLELETIEPGVAVMCLCDIRDRDTLEKVFSEHRPQLVLHAAAYKHVPVMELSPAEAIKTNVLGTLQVVEACERHAAEKFVLVSTDKAVAPANMMGFTKSVAERVMTSAACRGALTAVAVRFGNVLASRGSVVPIFEEQLRHGGPLTVTDREVTRYFMTIPEAARLILQAQAIGNSGDIFVLEMGEPVRIVDLAKKMIALSGVPAEIVFIGLRPGEKLHESLIFEHEDLEPTSRPNILRVRSALTCGIDYDGAIRELIRAAGSSADGQLRDAVGRLDPDFAERQASAV